MKLSEIRLGDLFDVQSPVKRFNANSVRLFNERVPGSYPYVVRRSSNNGRRGYIIEDECYLSPEKTIAFGQDTATAFYQNEPYFTGDKIKVLTYRYGVLSERVALYYIALMQRAFYNFSWGETSFDEEVLKDVVLLVPVTDAGTPDVLYIERYTAKIEQKQLAQVNAFLKNIGLDSCELTSDEKNAINAKPKMKEFRIGDLFEKLPSTYYGTGPRNEFVAEKQSSEYPIPVLTAKRGNNGICRWAKAGLFETYENVVSIVYNGAIAAGLSYAQEGPVGVLTDAYVIRLKNKKSSQCVNLYLSCAIQKVTYEKYSREDKAVWTDRVENDVILLPVTSSGVPDYEYMENYIRAQEKLVIKDTLKLKERISAEIAELTKTA